MAPTGLLPQIAGPLRAQALQCRGTCGKSGSSILHSVMSTPESRPRRAVPVRWPGLRERKHVEAYPPLHLADCAATALPRPCTRCRLRRVEPAPFSWYETIALT